MFFKCSYRCWQVIHYHGQILAINECAYRQIYDAKYLLHNDLDEFVVPTAVDDWSSMIDYINAAGKSATQRDHIASYSFRNRFFPLEFPDVGDQVASLPRDAMHKRGLRGVRLSVTFVDSLETNKHIIKIFFAVD